MFRLDAHGQDLHLRFQTKPWDLYACFAYTIALLAFVLGLGLGSPVAILLIFIIPGYVTMAAIYPLQGVIGWDERFAFSLGLSVIIIPVLGLSLNLTGVGIRFVPALLATALYVMLVGLFAYHRRMQVPAERRLCVTIDFAWPRGEQYTFIDKASTLALAIGVVAAAGFLAYVVVTPRPSGRFTEFYLLGGYSNASGYPTRLNISELGTVLFGIANHESASVSYTIRVDLVGVQIVRNTTTQKNGTVEVNRTTWSWSNVTLRDGQNWTEPYAFSISKAGLWAIQFFLFKNGDFTAVYRELHMYVRVG